MKYAFNLQNFIILFVINKILFNFYLYTFVIGVFRHILSTINIFVYININELNYLQIREGKIECSINVLKL